MKENIIMSETQRIAIQDKFNELFRLTCRNNDTIKNNIAYANLDASEHEINEAAKFSFAYVTLELKIIKKKIILKYFNLFIKKLCLN